MKFFCFFAFVLISCASPRIKTNYTGKSFFRYEDPSGNYVLKRDVLEIASKIQVRQQLLSINSPEIPLEKSITISEMGRVKKQKSIRPVISQFSVWFEKKKYFAQFKLDKNIKKLNIILKSPEPKWNSTKNIEMAKGIVFCWFSQIPECIRRAGLLSRNKGLKKRFKVIWENYPYLTEQYRNVPSKLFSDAMISYDGMFQENHKYNIQIDNQILIYHFSESLEFEKMFWISQGISIIKR